jgi:hypothetical protein
MPRLACNSHTSFEKSGAYPNLAIRVVPGARTAHNSYCLSPDFIPNPGRSIAAPSGRGSLGGPAERDDQR